MGAFIAKLVIKDHPTLPRELELRAGKNCVGRNPANDVLIEHPTVSSYHAQITVTDIAVVVEDLGSTNGSFMDGQPLKKGVLQSGHTLRFGDVEMILQIPEVQINIPDLPKSELASSIVFDDGSFSCLNHHDVLATLRCTKCQDCFCDQCVRVLKRFNDAAPLLFCPNCSGSCESMTIVMTKPKKQSFFGKLQETLKLTQPKNARKRR